MGLLGGYNILPNSRVPQSGFRVGFRSESCAHFVRVSHFASALYNTCSPGLECLGFRLQSLGLLEKGFMSPFLHGSFHKWGAPI